MQGLAAILDACAAAERDGRSTVLATIVRARGSTYRRPGARMLFPDGGSPVGLIGGGCLEADLEERARAVFDSGEPRTVVYDLRSPDDVVWGLGLGCQGDVVVLLERLVPGQHPDALRFLRACSRERSVGVLATLFRIEGAVEACVGDRLMLNAEGAALSSIGDPELRRALERDAREVLASGRTTVREYTLANGRAEICLEHVAPATALQVFGAGEDAVPVVRLALALGFTVAVADSRPGRARADAFPGAHGVRCIDFDRLDAAGLVIDRGTAVLVMTHHFLHDLVLMRFLLGTPAFYVGFLGPAQRWRNLLQELDRQGVHPTPEQRARLHGPVGLDIGAETPEEIALSVLAEIRAVVSGRTGGFLRDRPGPLHDA